MEYTLAFVSTDPIRRRMAQSSRSVSPGFPAVINSINETNQTCDLWVEGSDYVLKGVTYSTGFKKKPDYIQVGSPVYVRHSDGNKFDLAIEGPSHVVPTVKAGTTPLPVPGTLPDGIVSGLQVVASAYPAMTVAVTTGSARFGGIVSTFIAAKVGESLNAKVTGATPGVLKLGAGKFLANTYCYFPVPNNASSTNYRYDQVELGSDGILDYIQGVASTSPQLTVPQSGHKILGSILVRPQTTRILPDDINTKLLGFGAIQISPSEATVAAATPTVWFTLTLLDQNGNPRPNVFVVPSLRDGLFQPAAVPADYGYVEIAGGYPTNSSGQVLFIYNRAGAIKSPYIFFQSASGDIAYASITLLDAGGVPLPR